MSDDEENKPLQCASLCDFSKHIGCSNLTKPEQVLDKTLFVWFCRVFHNWKKYLYSTSRVRGRQPFKAVRIQSLMISSRKNVQN
jgi:hypothetical protein